MVIANMVGTGVFTSLCFQTFDLTTGFSILFLWLLGGVIAFCGSVAYSELATIFPRNGGEYNLLSHIYHPSVGFLAGWVSVTVGFAAPVALAAMALGEYLKAVVPQVEPLRVSIAVVILVSIIHSVSVKFGSLFQNFFTIFKIILIFILIIGGVLFAQPQMVNFYPSTLSFKEIFSNPFAISLVYVSYTYSGWNAATYITSEIQNPQKNVPRALLLGTLFVTLLYIGLNFIFLYTIPFSEINPSKLELGVVAAKNSFGHKYGIILGIGLSLALIASISSMIFAGPRVTQVVGEDYSFFRFASIRNKNGAPYVATLVQMTITLLLLLTSTFKDIFTYVAFTLSLITLLTVFGVFIVRFKKLSNLNNYRTWGYPITPIIFILLTSWMLVYALISAPKPSLLGLATAISGLVFYYLSPKNLNLTLQSKKITHKK